VTSKVHYEAISRVELAATERSSSSVSLTDTSCHSRVEKGECVDKLSFEVVNEAGVKYLYRTMCEKAYLSGSVGTKPNQHDSLLNLMHGSVVM